MGRDRHRRLRGLLIRELREHTGTTDERVLADIVIGVIDRNFHVVPRTALPCVVFPQEAESPGGA